MSTHGKCEHCEESFTYELWHTGFSDAAYAYCEKCGCVAMVDAWTAPKGTKVRFHQAVPEEAEEELAPCACGGRFKRNASPRCPKCIMPLSDEKSAGWIEANAPGTAKGWKWQKTWTGLYAFCVEGRFAKSPWKLEAIQPPKARTGSPAPDRD